jgi:diguanylate cyclase (GGDEF)-like protein
LSRYLVALARSTAEWPRRRAALIAASLFALLVIADRLTGPQVNLVFLYIMLASFTAWCLGERIGLVVGVATVIAAGAQNGFHFGYTPRDGTASIYAMAWNMAGRTLTTTTVVLLTCGLRGALEMERWRAETDGLTGVLNKAAFARRMDANIASARRHGDSLVLAYLDLDGFKGVNDGFGHGAGDLILKAFATSAAESIRDADLFARIGGDEFVALLTVPDCDRGDAVAEMLHYRLDLALRQTGHAVTCSIGAMVVEAAAVEQSAALVDAADRLMYEVKRAGKNAIRIARGDLAGLTVGSPYPPATPEGGRAGPPSRHMIGRNAA